MYSLSEENWLVFNHFNCQRGMVFKNSAMGVNAILGHRVNIFYTVHVLMNRFQLHILNSICTSSILQMLLMEVCLPGILAPQLNK